MFTLPNDGNQNEDVSEYSYERHDPVEDQEHCLDLGYKDESLLRVAGVKCAVLGARVVHLGNQSI